MRVFFTTVVGAVFVVTILSLVAAAFGDPAFGHTGFTGTSIWIDQERKLFVVLLTNRVNPTRDRGGIGELRRTVHEIAVRGVDGVRATPDTG